MIHSPIAYMGALYTVCVRQHTLCCKLTNVILYEYMSCLHTVCGMPIFSSFMSIFCSSTQCVVLPLASHYVSIHLNNDSSGRMSHSRNPSGVYDLVALSLSVRLKSVGHRREAMAYLRELVLVQFEYLPGWRGGGEVVGLVFDFVGDGFDLEPHENEVWHRAYKRIGRCIIWLLHTMCVEGFPLDLTLVFKLVPRPLYSDVYWSCVVDVRDASKGG
jgi:hypothetical protein